MIKVNISDNEVSFTFCGDTYISHNENIIRRFKECNNDRERSSLAINLSVDSSFDIISNKNQNTKTLSTLNVLEGCAHTIRKLSSYDYDELDDLLGADPYIPLY